MKVCFQGHQEGIAEQLPRWLSWRILDITAFSYGYACPWPSMGLASGIAWHRRQIRLTPNEISEACDRAASELLDGPLTPDAAWTIATALEAITYDLALIMVEAAEKYGETREIALARASLSLMDERLAWVQRNRSDAVSTKVHTALDAALQCGRQVLLLVRHQTRVRTQAS